MKSVKHLQIVPPSAFTDEQRAQLRAASRAAVLESLARLIGDGKVTVSQVQAQYGALMMEVGRA
jgi:hypothetical protein